jgi:aryl-alcohol dehydrogenase-like predicted oxidoreductase
MGVPTVPLDRGGLRVSALALGTAPLGNLFAPVPEEDAAATVRAALEAGLTYVDTAPHYGLGLAERRLGRLLGGLPRDRFVVSTKVGRLVRPLAPGETADPEGFADSPPAKRVWDFSGDGVRRSLEESLERLGLDRVDILLLHDPDDHERDFPRFRRITRFVDDLATGSGPAEPASAALTCGTVEENLHGNRVVRDALAARGWQVALHEHRDAHNWVAWRDTFDPWLVGLLRELWA